MTVTNGGSTDLTLNGTIVTNENTKAEREGSSVFTNLEYRPVTLEGETYTIGGTATPLAQAKDGVANIGTITVQANQTSTTYALIYLNDNGNQSAEMGATYKGQIVYTSAAGNGSQLTGTFIVG